MTHYYFIAVH